MKAIQALCHLQKREKLQHNFITSYSIISTKPTTSSKTICHNFFRLYLCLHFAFENFRFIDFIHGLWSIDLYLMERECVFQQGDLRANPCRSNERRWWWELHNKGDLSRWPLMSRKVLWIHKSPKNNLYSFFFWDSALCRLNLLQSMYKTNFTSWSVNGEKKCTNINGKSISSKCRLSIGGAPYRVPSWLTDKHTGHLIDCIDYK